MSTPRTPLKAISGKPKKCAVRTCRASFVPTKTFQTWCSPECGLALAMAKQEKERKAVDRLERQEIRVRRQRLKGRREYLEEAQIAFNAWVRERDRGQPCISCGTRADVQYCAGHYRTVGACPELRFEPLNVHRQCNKNCNLERSGNIVEYRIRLVQKIGAEAVAWLEGPHEPKKYTIDELKQLTVEYRQKLRELKKRVGSHE